MDPVTLEDINRKLDYLIGIIQFQGQKQQLNLTPEERQAMLNKATEIYAKLKKEADEELEQELERRREAGIGKDGDALTQDDLKKLEQEAW